MAVNVLISAFAMQTLQFKGVALANIVSGWLNFLALLIFSYIKIGFKFHVKTFVQIIKYIAASVLMILAIYLWREHMLFLAQRLLIISEIIIGFFTYLAACYIFRVDLHAKNW